MPSILGRDLFDDFFSFPFGNFRTSDMPKTGMMKTDIREDKNGYVLEIEMPGYKKEDISINLEDGYVTVSAKKDDKDSDKDGSVYLRRERSVSCSRSYYVGDVEVEDVDAKFEGGVLYLTLPKEKEKAATSHNIQIK